MSTVRFGRFVSMHGWLNVVFLCYSLCGETSDTNQVPCQGLRRHSLLAVLFSRGCTWCCPNRRLFGIFCSTRTSSLNHPGFLADEAMPSVITNTDGDDDAAKRVDQHGGQRRPADDRWDYGQYWGKRHRKNQPSDLSDETWAAGVSETPVAGWQTL